MRVYIPSDNNNADCYLLGDRTNSDNTKWNQTSITLNTTDNALHFYEGLGNTLNTVEDYQYFIPTLWQDIAITYDHSTNLLLTFYGGQQHSNVTLSSAYPGGGSVLYVGSSTVASDFYVTDIKVFNSALTTQQIYNLGAMAANT